MPEYPKDKHSSGNTDRPNRAQLLEARAELERQIADLSYKAIIGGGFSPSAKPELIERLKTILDRINRELAVTDA